MELLLFYSPLEQFEFTLIGGKLLQDIGIYDRIAPLDKNYIDSNIEILVGNSPYREYYQSKLDKCFNFMIAFAEPRIFGTPYAHDKIYEMLLTTTLKTELMNSSMAESIYKNLDFFYIQEQGLELIAIYTQVFNEILSDDKIIWDTYNSSIDANKWYLVFVNEGLQIENSKALEAKDKTFAILAAYVLNDLYTYYQPYGINPNLHYITFNFYGWVSDRLLLNDITGENFEYKISDYVNNVRGLSALEMTTRDYSALSFYWLNIYNSLFIVISLIILIFIVFNKGFTRVPNVWQILNTLTFDFLLKSFISLANRNLLAFFPIFFCFFIFIYLLNLTALTPFSFCLTSNLWFSLSLSFSIWFGVTALAIIVKGGKFFTGFVPSNISSNELKAFITVIEVISYVARALSLGVRIFANMLAGHSLVHILSDLTATCFVEFDNIGLKIFGIFPAIILSFILVIEFGICFLQGLVFVILTAIYLKEAFEQGH